MTYTWHAWLLAVYLAAKGIVIDDCPGGHILHPSNEEVVTGEYRCGAPPDAP